MDDQSMPTPIKSRLYWFTSLPHPVQAALIGLLGTSIVSIVALVGELYKSHSKATRLDTDVTSLQNTVSAQKEQLRTKDVEIQRLETLLTPFKTIALEKYTGSEAEVLRRLGLRLQQIEDSDTLKTKKIVNLEVELQKTKELAQPNNLILRNKSVRHTNDALILTLSYGPSKYEDIGPVELIAILPIGSQSKITDFWPVIGEPILTGDQSKEILKDGQAAHLLFKPLGMNVNVELTVTSPTKVKIKGNKCPEPIEVEIK